MTIAENIAQTPINDLDDDAGLQLATGHSDNWSASALAATDGANPVVSGCNLSATMENAANAYSASSCEIREPERAAPRTMTKVITAQARFGRQPTMFPAPPTNPSLERISSPTAMSSGTLSAMWEWTDAYINGTADRMAVAADAWQEWSVVTDYNNLSYTRPQNPSWSSTNGIGKVYVTATVGQRGFVRGGNWGSGAIAGVSHWA